MKPVTIILLMGVAALAGGLLVRYNDHPVVIAPLHAVPPKVIAPPIALNTPLPSTALPAQPKPVVAGVPTPTEKPSPYQNPEPVTEPVHVAKRVSRPDPKPAPVRLAQAPPPAVKPPRQNPEPVAVPPIQTEHPAPRVPVQSPTPQPEPNEVTIKAGSLLPVRIHEALSSDHNGQGEVFTGVLTKPLIADGFAIAEPGARVRGFVVDVRAARGKASAELTLRIREVATSDGQWVHVSTSPWTLRGTAGNIQLWPETNVTFRLDQPVDVVERR